MLSYLHRAMAAAAFAAALSLSAGPAMAESGDAANAATAAEMKPYTETVTGPRGGKASFEMIPIPKPGSGASLTFTMGSPGGEDNRRDDEGPQFKVTVEPFWMAKTETTWDLFWKYMDERKDMEVARVKKGYKIPEDRKADAISIPTVLWEQDAGPRYRAMGFTKDDPVVAASQFAAKQFSKWVSKRTGRFYRLPTAAEWEYAARAGTTTAYWYGDDAGDSDDYEWTFTNSEYEDPDKGFPDEGAGYRKVATLKPNPWGLHDMHGNVSEWVLDQYVPDHYKKFAGKTVTWKEALAWPTTHFPREVRGGAWYYDPEDSRAAARIASDGDNKTGWRKDDPQIPKSVWFFTDVHAFSTGFRLIRPLTEPSDEEKLKYWEPDLDVIREVLKKDKQGQILVDDPPSKYLDK